MSIRPPHLGACLGVCLASLAALGAACGKDQRATTLPDQPPAVRTASSFIHCVEATTSGCVQPHQAAGGWDALYLLIWLSDGSPVAILEALPRELAKHGDASSVERRFVDEVERYATAIRGAECDPVEARPLGPLIDQATQSAANRLELLGLRGSGLEQVIEGLAEEAHQQLDGGHLVEMQCRYDPHRLYVATTERAEQYQVVGMTTLLPRRFGGGQLDAQTVDDRLHSRSLGLAGAQAPIIEGTVHPYLRFPVEVF